MELTEIKQRRLYIRERIEAAIRATEAKRDRIRLAGGHKAVVEANYDVDFDYLGDTWRSRPKAEELNAAISRYCQTGEGLTDVETAFKAYARSCCRVYLTRDNNRHQPEPSWDEWQGVLRQYEEAVVKGWPEPFTRWNVVKDKWGNPVAPYDVNYRTPKVAELEKMFGKYVPQARHTTEAAASVDKADALFGGQDESNRESGKQAVAIRGEDAAGGVPQRSLDGHRTGRKRVVRGADAANAGGSDAVVGTKGTVQRGVGGDKRPAARRRYSASRQGASDH